jgi:hypothetical protein
VFSLTRVQQMALPWLRISHMTNTKLKYADHSVVRGAVFNFEGQMMDDDTSLGNMANMNFGNEQSLA